MAEVDRRGLVLDSIYFDFSGKRILHGVYLHLAPGRVSGLFGRNGSGKSTLMRIAAGQLLPTSGHVIIDGVNFRRRSVRRRFAHIAYLPQKSMLPAATTVARVLASLNTGLAADEVIAPLLGRRIEALSGGELRYLELQIVLGLGRDYLLLDEPFTGVEPHLIDKICEAITHASAGGAGVLLTDHYYRYALPIVHDAYLLQDFQCRHLDSDRDLAGQLSQHGYLR